MSGINRIIVTGNLTRDPELRETGQGVPLCDMRIAIQTQIKEDADVCFVDVTAWEKQAESCNEHLHKGAWILIEGRLHLREWTTRAGEKRSKHSIVAHRVVFLDKGEREGQGPADVEKASEGG